jgi:hypothetical protein
LRVDNFYVLLILPKEQFEVKEGLLDALSQLADSLRLCETNPSVNSFSSEQDIIAQIVTAHSLRVSNRVDLA